MQKRMQKRTIKLVVISRVLLYNKKAGKYIAVKIRILRFPTAARLKNFACSECCNNGDLDKQLNRPEQERI